MIGNQFLEVPYIKKTQKIEPQNIETTNNKLENAQLDMAIQSKKLVEALYNNANTKAQTSEDIIGKREKFKEQMTEPNNVLPNEVYDALVADILEHMGSSIDKFETNPNKLTEQIFEELSNTVYQGTKNVTVDKSVYKINYTLMSAWGMGDAFIDITGGGYKEHLCWTNVDSKDGIEALAAYCAALAQLNTDLWKEFLAYYVSDGFGLLDIKTVTKDKVLDVLNKTEKVIKALCDKDDADALVEEMGDTVKDKLKSRWTNQFKKFVKENVPNGDKIIKAADKYNTLKKKYKKLSTLWNQDPASSKTEKAYNDFRTAYNAFEIAVNGL